MDRLKAELVATRAKNGVYIPLDQFEQREQVRLNCLFNVHASPSKDMLMPKSVLLCKNHSHMSSPPKVLGRLLPCCVPLSPCLLVQMLPSTSIASGLYSSFPGMNRRS